jgi:hypothetical protein
MLPNKNTFVATFKTRAEKTEGHMRHHSNRQMKLSDVIRIVAE